VFSPSSIAGDFARPNATALGENTKRGDNTHPSPRPAWCFHQAVPRAISQGRARQRLVKTPSAATILIPPAALLGVFTKQYHERIRIAEHDSAW